MQLYTHLHCFPRSKRNSLRNREPSKPSSFLKSKNENYGTVQTLTKKSKYSCVSSPGRIRRIRMFLSFADPDPLVYHQAKIVRKKLIPTVL